MKKKRSPSRRHSISQEVNGFRRIEFAAAAHRHACLKNPGFSRCPQRALCGGKRLSFRSALCKRIRRVGGSTRAGDAALSDARLQMFFQRRRARMALEPFLRGTVCPLLEYADGFMEGGFGLNGLFEHRQINS